MKKTQIILLILVLIVLLIIILVACNNNDSVEMTYLNEDNERVAVEISQFDELPILSKKGYEFLGWQVVVDGENIELSEEVFLELRKSDNEIEIIPKWRKNLYMVTYVGVDETINNNITQYTVDDEEILLNNPLTNDESLEFEGWFYEDEKIMRINTSLAKDLIIEAKWGNKCQVSVKCKFNETIVYSELFYLSVGETKEYEAPELLGYIFKEYSTGETSQTTNITPMGNLEIIIKYDIETREMPILFIVTNNYQQPYDKETYINSSISMMNTQESYAFENKSAGIRLRGNTTLNLPKKSFRIKFDKKQSILGSSYKAKSWTLIANYLDRTLSRNYIAHELAEQFADVQFASKHDWVEVYLNGEYLGVYLLCDQIQTGEGRVDIDERTINEDIGKEPGDVGYLLEMDQVAFKDGEENRDYIVVKDKLYAIKTPDTDSIDYNANASCTFISTYLEDCFIAFDNMDYTAVCDLIDVDSFVDTYIIQELFANTDVGKYSFYLYKDSGGKLTAGPVWDFDISSGIVDYATGLESELAESPNSTLYAKNENIWYEKLIKFDEVKGLIKAKLTSYNSIILSVINELDVNNEQGIFKKYTNSLTLNYKKWKVMGVQMWPMPSVPTSIVSIEGQIEYLRLWLTVRYYYMTSEYNKD